MKYFAIPLALVLAVAGCAQTRSEEMIPGRLENPPIAANAAERRILDTISEAVQAGETYANVPALDGRMLRVLTEATGAKQVLEIGTSTGISGLWFTLALRNTGGHLTTLELDPRRAATARSHFEKAGVSGLITVIEGDAHQTAANVKGPVDVVFIDAEKGGYVRYLEQVLPLVRPGGLILAHNVEMAPAYMKAVNSNPALETVYYMQGNHLGITLKKR